MSVGFVLVFLASGRHWAVHQGQRLGLGSSRAGQQPPPVCQAGSCTHAAAVISPAPRVTLASCCRLKDIIYGFGTNNVYVVLECMDCDLRHLLDSERQLEMAQIKVCGQGVQGLQQGPSAACLMERSGSLQTSAVPYKHDAAAAGGAGVAAACSPSCAKSCWQSTTPTCTA